MSSSSSNKAANVRDVEEAVLVLVLLVDARHEGGRGRQDLVDEDEDGLFGRELDTLADDVDKLADGQVRGDQVLLLVDGGNVGLFDLFADYLVEGGRGLDGERERAKRGRGVCLRECGRCTFGGCAPPQPCASQRGARP